MRDVDIVKRKPIILPVLSGLIWILALSFIGYAAPVFQEMYQDFEIDIPFYMGILSNIRWFWTLPVGGCIAGFIIWRSQLAEGWTTRKCVCVLLVSIISVVFVIFLFGCFVMRPVFDMGGLRTLSS